MSVAVVALSLVTGSPVSIVFGLRAEQARPDAVEHARNEATAKQDAELARGDAQRQLIDLSGAAGLTAAREGDDALALLWFARAVQLAKDDPQRQELNRIRCANWLRAVSLPEAHFTIPDFRPAQHRFRTFEFSPDGKYLLVVASTGDCLVCDCVQDRLVALSAPASKASAAAWQPGTGQLAVAEKNGQIQFLAPPEFRPAEELATGAEIAVLAFSRDGRRLAWGGTADARVWDREKKEYVAPLLAHGKPVTSLSFSADGELLATSCRDFKARVFRVAPEEPQPLFPPVPHTLGEYMDLRGGPEQVAPRFAADDRVFLTVERTPQGPYSLVWRSAATGRVLRFSTAPSAQDFQTVFAVSRAGDRVASAVWEGDGQLWDARNQKALANIHVARFRWFEDLAFSADGKSVATGGWDRTARLWSTADWENNQLAPSSPSILHPVSVVRVRLSPDGRHLAAALMDGSIHLWRLRVGPPIAYIVNAGGTTLPALSPDGRVVLPRATSFRNGTQKKTRVYDAETGAAAGAQIDLDGILVDAAFSPDGTRVATASLTARTIAERQQGLFEPEGKSGNVQVWDWKTGQRTAGPIPVPSKPRGLAFRPNGCTLAVVCADYHVVLCDPKTAKITHSLDLGMCSRPQNANFWWSNGEARFSPDGRFLVTWELAYAVHVWNPDQGRLLHTLTHGHRIDHVAFNPVAPDILATSCRDNVVRVWDLATGKLLISLTHPSHPIHRVRFSPDGTELITNGGDDGILRVWDWRAGQLKDGLALHPAMMTDFDFTADRRWLVTLGMDELQVTDWQTKSPAGPLWKLKRGLNLALEIPRGDRRAIVGGFSGSLVGYDMEKMVTPASAPVDELARLAEVAAGRRILDQGNVAPLSSAEWCDRWQGLQRTRSALLANPQR